MRKLGMKVRSLLIVFILLEFIAATSFAFAEISIEDRTGPITITSPDGKAKSYETDEEIPEIPNRSKIQIQTGEAHIAVSENSVAYVLVDGTTITLAQDAEISLNVILQQDGNYDTHVQVEDGNVRVQNPDGSTRTLITDEEIYIPTQSPMVPDPS